VEVRKVAKGGEDDERDSSQLDTLSRELKGNTLIVYWFLLRHNKPYSAREIQRSVGISSASLALHHLNKLIELGLVGTDDDGQYVVTKRISPGLLSLRY
jgi:predicted DNA-binding transcriptional regulator